MDYAKEINQLAGETFALQALLVALVGRMSAVDAGYAALARGAFDDAARFVEDRAIQFGRAAAPEHMVHSIRVVEELRTAIFGDKQQPKHRV